MTLTEQSAFECCMNTSNCGRWISLRTGHRVTDAWTDYPMGPNDGPQVACEHELNGTRTPSPLYWKVRWRESGREIEKTGPTYEAVLAMLPTSYRDAYQI